MPFWLHDRLNAWYQHSFNRFNTSKRFANQATRCNLRYSIYLRVGLHIQQNCLQLTQLYSLKLLLFIKAQFLIFPKISIIPNTTKEYIIDTKKSFDPNSLKSKPIVNSTNVMIMVRLFVYLIFCFIKRFVFIFYRRKYNHNK